MNLRKFVQSLGRQLRPIPQVKVYKSFDMALADSDGYEDPGVIEVVSHKTGRLKQILSEGENKIVRDRQILQNMFVLSHVWQNRPVDVLEIGGACGGAFLELNHLLPEKIRRWHIIETPSMAAAGKGLFEGDKLFFYHELEPGISGLSSLDLLIAQGVLEYLPEPLGSLEMFLNLGFSFVYITRTMAGEGIAEPILTKQVVDLSAHGPGEVPKGFANRKTSQPMTIVPLESISHRVRNGHRVLFSFNEGESSTIRVEKRLVTTRPVGFLLERIS